LAPVNGPAAWLSGIIVLWLASATGTAWAYEPAAVDQPSSGREQTGTSEEEDTPFKKMNLQELMNVEVSTVSRIESTVGQSPAAVHVITTEDIRRSGATTLAELFRMVPGLHVARIDGNKWGVGARGFTDRFVGKLLVQVDGRTVYNPINAGVYWDSVDYLLQDVERIEVIRGPGASVWGANAVNGIINIITRSAQETQVALITGGGGTEELGLGGFRYGDKIGENLFFRIYGKGFNRDRQFSAEGDPNDQWWAGRGGFRLDWKPSAADTLTLQGDYHHTVAGRRDSRPTLDTNVSPALVLTNVEDEVTSGGDFLVRWSRQQDEESNWTFQVYWDRFERHSTRNFFAFDINTLDLDFQQQFPLGARQKFVYGLGYRLNDIFFQGSTTDDAFAIGPALVKRNTQLVSAFVQDQFTLIDERLYLTAGTKLEHNDFTGFEVQPTGRLLWTPTPKHTAWLAVSRAVRTPAILENDVEVGLLPAPGPVFPRILPNRDLDSEELLAYELGSRAQVTERLSMDLALFYNDYDRLNVVVPGATMTNAAGTVILPLIRAYRMTAEAYGVELAATWQLTDWWRLAGAYTFLELHLHRDPGQPAIPASVEGPEGQSPQNQLYLQSSWNAPGGLQFDLIGRYVDRLPGFTPVVESYLSLDVRLAWRPRKDLEIAVVGQNLLDPHHAEFGTSPLLRSPRVELERGVYGSLTYWW
jgi:iron complex outermembrane receptor protein